MVNDQLIRIHHLRLLAHDKVSPKNDASPHSSVASSPQLSPLLGCTRALSSSAPESSFVTGDDLALYSEQLEENASLLDTKRTNLKDEHKKNRKRIQASSKSQNSSPSRYDFGKALKKQDSNDGGVIKRTTAGSTFSTSTKRRSSWRHLLSPSYKSRCDEFHKLFCDEIPKNERLVADYSCALHRDILIQGRIYISINYIAFYSNIFSWITKLVVRLRDVSEIYKANTAKIIPNAIQFVTNTGEKHVFASFLARDRSYVMILRIWRNNLLMDRMTDQEIRTLVHCSYGKDLGMSDNEELNINSPDPSSPSNVAAEIQPLEVGCIDGNNNQGQRESIGISEEAHSGNNDEPPPQRAPSPLDLSDELFGVNLLQDKHDTGEQGHSGYNSMDCRLRAGKQATHKQVADELVKRLNDLSKSQLNEAQRDHQSPKREIPGAGDEIAQINSPAPSSTVVVDTPDNNNISTRGHTNISRLNMSQDSITAPGNCNDDGEQGWPNDGGSCEDHIMTSASASERPDQKGDKMIEMNHDSRETVVGEPVSEQSQLVGQNTSGESHEGEQPSLLLPSPNVDSRDHLAKQQMVSEGELDVDCGCNLHEGQLIADEEFHIDVDTLFSLIFTNSKFMRTHMAKRGIYGAIISKWKRFSPSGTLTPGGGSSTGTKSNSSTLSSGGGGGERRASIESHANGTSVSSDQSTRAPMVKSNQVRQLNFSMKVNHILAKQVEVTEEQKICAAKPGVYVLKSISLNSGAPYSETFTIDITYCLTRHRDPHKSRMLVHCVVNFKKEKHSWKLAMIKSTIEKSSISGVSEFVTDLVGSIKEYIDRKKRKRCNEGSGLIVADELSVEGLSIDKRSRRTISSARGHSKNTERGDLNSSSGQQVTPKAMYATNQGEHVNKTYSNNRQKRASLARAKSKLKEKKLRSMYKYYMSSDANGSGDNMGESMSGKEDVQEGGSDEADNDSSFSGTSDDGGVCGHSGSMLAEDVDSSEQGDEDNGSMIMMITTHETDSQVSDNGVGVRNSHRHRHQQRHQQQLPRRTLSGPQRTITTVGNLDLERFVSGSGGIIVSIIISLLLTIVALALMCFVILRRLDLIEDQLRHVNSLRHNQRH